MINYEDNLRRLQAAIDTSRAEYDDEFARQTRGTIRGSHRRSCVTYYTLSLMLRVEFL